MTMLLPNLREPQEGPPKPLPQRPCPCPWNPGSNVIHCESHPWSQWYACLTGRPQKDGQVCSAQLRPRFSRTCLRRLLCIHFKSSTGDFGQANTRAKSVLTTTLEAKLVRRWILHPPSHGTERAKLLFTSVTMCGSFTDFLNFSTH